MRLTCQKYDDYGSPLILLYHSLRKHYDLITPERDHRGRQLAARASDGPSSDMDEDPPPDPPDPPPALDPLEVEDVVGTLLGLDPGGHPIASWSDRLPSLPLALVVPLAGFS